jgi:uncharacterized SAM-binding protein YcdF (DUF218 family)
VPLTEENILSQLNKTEKTTNNQPQAIIVLKGGRRKGALEAPIDYHQQDLSPSSLERLRYGARIAKQTNLPILVTGGAPDKTDTKDLAEAQVMKIVLENEYSMSPKWMKINPKRLRRMHYAQLKSLKKRQLNVFIWSPIFGACREQRLILKSKI